MEGNIQERGGAAVGWWCGEVEEYSGEGYSGEGGGRGGRVVVWRKRAGGEAGWWRRGGVWRCGGERPAADNVRTQETVEVLAVCELFYSSTALGSQQGCGGKTRRGGEGRGKIVWTKEECRQ